VWARWPRRCRGRADGRISVARCSWRRASSPVFEVAAGVAPNVGLAFLALVAVGYCHTIYNSASLTALQLLPPEELRTRTVSLYTLLFLGLQPIGSLLSGYLADGLGIRQAMVIEGLACLTAVGAASIYARRAAAN
jgi:MFS family permease